MENQVHLDFRAWRTSPMIDEDMVMFFMAVKAGVDEAKKRDMIFMSAIRDEGREFNVCVMWPEGFHPEMDEVEDIVKTVKKNLDKIY